MKSVKTLMFSILVILVACAQNPTNPTTDSNGFIFMEYQLKITSEIVSGKIDTNKIERGVLIEDKNYTFDKQNRRLDVWGYKTIQSNGNVLGGFKYDFDMPHLSGSQGIIQPLFSNQELDDFKHNQYLYSSDNNHLYFKINDRLIALPIDSTINTNYSTFEEIVDVDEDTAVVQLYHDLTIINHGVIQNSNVNLN